MKAAELKASSLTELEKQLTESLQEIFTLRMQKTTGQLKKTHLLRQERRNIARVKTVLTEKKVKAHD